VNITRLGRRSATAGVAVIGMLALAACGSDNNTPATSGSAAASGAAISCQSGSIKASGSSAQKNAITQWITDYQTACSGATINYSPSGSGAGVQDFINNQTAFAGSDSALTDAQHPQADARCKTGAAVDIPMVVGPVAVAYNVSGLTKLVLTPDVIAKIFNGTITTWNDPAIAAINSGATLPSAPIAAFHRSDSSGTTDNFTKYMIAAAGTTDWPYPHAKDWPSAIKSGQGAKGSDGVASALKSTANSIGYLEYSFTTDGSLGVAQVDNGGGPVTLTPATAAAAIASAQVTGTGDDLTVSIDYATKTPGAYPIVLVTYEITCVKGLSSSDLPLTKSFLTYIASTAGQAKLTGLGYAPLPDTLAVRVRALVDKIS
jgi:phosphate transport system substrate-binding protein